MDDDLDAMGRQYDKLDAQADASGGLDGQA